MLLLSLETGDVTTEMKGVRNFQVEADRPLTRVRLSLSDAEDHIGFDAWPNLVAQVKDNELVKRHSPGDLQPPLSEIANVIQQIKSTPTFQLFLAGIDIAERIDLVSESPAETVKRRFKFLNKWVPSVTGAGGLFFVPEEMSVQFHSKAAHDLLLNNKLCSAAFGDMKRYYIPYATPIGFILNASREAETLWDEIRTLYYAFRHSA